MAFFQTRLPVAQERRPGACADDLARSNRALWCVAGRRSSTDVHRAVALARVGIVQIVHRTKRRP